jgi:hypothetical protein
MQTFAFHRPMKSIVEIFFKKTAKLVEVCLARQEHRANAKYACHKNPNAFLPR